MTIDDPTGDTQDEYINQAQMAWDADGDGDIDFTQVSDDPNNNGDTDPSVLSIEALSETGDRAALPVVAGATILAVLTVITLASVSKNHHKTNKV